MVVDELELEKLRAGAMPNAADPERARALTVQARGMSSSGDAKGARALLQAALVLAPCDSEALRCAGDVALQLDDAPVAKRCYERALLENPSDWRSARALAGVHRDLGRPDRARAILAMLASDASVPAEALVAL